MGKFDGTSLSASHIGAETLANIERLLSGNAGNAYFVDPYNRFYGGDDRNIGSVDKPMETIEAAVERAKREVGNDQMKYVYVLPVPALEDGDVDQFILQNVILRNVRNLWLEPLGSPEAWALAGGFHPYPITSDTHILITNATDASLAAFGADGGVDFTHDPWAWTGGDFALLEESDPSFRGESTDYDEFNLNITIKGVSMNSASSLGDLGAEQRDIMVLWADAPGAVESIGLKGIELRECSADVFMHNAWGPRLIGCRSSSNRFDFLNSFAPTMDFLDDDYGSADETGENRNIFVYDATVTDTPIGSPSIIKSEIPNSKGVLFYNMDCDSTELHVTPRSRDSVIFDINSGFGVDVPSIVTVTGLDYRSGRASNAYSLRVEDFTMNGAGSILAHTATVLNNIAFDLGTLDLRDAHVYGNVTVAAAVTALTFYGDIHGNLTLTAGGPAPTIRGRVFGNITDPDNHLGGGAGPYAGAGNYINV